MKKVTYQKILFIWIIVTIKIVNHTHQTVTKPTQFLKIHFLPEYSKLLVNHIINYFIIIYLIYTIFLFKFPDKLTQSQITNEIEEIEEITVSVDESQLNVNPSSTTIIEGTYILYSCYYKCV